MAALGALIANVAADITAHWHGKPLPIYYSNPMFYIGSAILLGATIYLYQGLPE
jgi:hypothetical protein